ncbi:MAG: hypothetical protein OHK0039_33400 [Bacteroidia bacterium]
MQHEKDTQSIADFVKEKRGVLARLEEAVRKAEGNGLASHHLLLRVQYFGRLLAVADSASGLRALLADMQAVPAFSGRDWLLREALLMLDSDRD